MGDKVTLAFTVPGPDTPGYLRRMRQALRFSQTFTSGAPEPEDLDHMVEFLADFVTVPADRTEAIEALWMATEDEFRELLNAVIGGSGQAAVPPTNSEKSESG